MLFLPLFLTLIHQGIGQLDRLVEIRGWRIERDDTYAEADRPAMLLVLDTLILPGVNGSCMELFLQEVSGRHPHENILMVLDGAGGHKNQTIPLPSNLRLLFLPPYSPELNPVEYLWDNLREKSFHNRVFDSIDAPESHLEQEFAVFEENSQRAKSITHWPWIINALSNAN